MVFIILVIFAIALYVWGYKISALIIFFFFITSGFNLVPEEVMEVRVFSKGMDYAILIIVGIVIINSIFVKGFLKPDKFILLILIFYAFLGICVIYNILFVGTGLKEIIRTIRYNILWIAYLVFRSLSKEQLQHLMKCLFLVTVFCSVLFILQIFFDVFLLNEGGKVPHIIFGYKITRFYNQPDMLQIFTFMAIYFNPFKGVKKITTTTILILALLGAFHRSLIIAFILAISIGYIIRLPRPKRIAVMTSLSIIGFIFIIFFGYKFANSRTIKDISLVVSGDAANIESLDIDIEDLQKSTFTFRITHLLERNQYLLEHPTAMLFGAGLMTEDSNLADKMFDFKIGLFDETLGKTVQLDTGDISYSVLIMRYGYIGTFIYLFLFAYLMVFFYKNKESGYGIFSFLYLIVAICVSFFSSNLLSPTVFLLPLISYGIIKEDLEKVSYNY